MTLLERLAEIEERLRAATPGPWALDQEQGWPIAFACGDYEGVKYNVHTAPMSSNSISNAKRDAELIAHAPQDLAMLLEIVKVQAEALEFYADGELKGDLEIRPEKKELWSIPDKWSQRSMSDHYAGRRAREALTEIERLAQAKGDT